MVGGSVLGSGGPSSLRLRSARLGERAESPQWESRDVAPTNPYADLPDPCPFPPIGDYGFLSDCETTALVAPSGRSSGCACRGWTRRACSAPSSTGTPAASASARPTCGCRRRMRYLPGTMVLETSWGTPDRLDHRARRPAHGPVAPRGRASRAPTGVRPPTTTPTTSCCGHGALRRTARCRSPWTASRCSTTAATPAQWSYADRALPPGQGHRRGSRRRAHAHHGHAHRVRGLRARSPGTLLKEGDNRFVRAVVERASRRP